MDPHLAQVWAPPAPKTVITIGAMITIGEIRSKTPLGASNDDQATAT
jgi:hypothetical protein